jgi:hypothetical protein
MKRIFAQITKVDVEKREVWGRAVAEERDRAGEIFDYESSKPLFDKWSGDIEKATDGKSLGNIRAMHGAVAAGKVIAYQPDDAAKAIDIGTKIVDDAEWQKVEEGVYTGFSIGGKYVKRWKDEGDPTSTRYTADPFEISLVDLPCVPTAQFSMVKMGGAVEQLALRPYGVMKTVLAKDGLTTGDVLTLASEYLPSDDLSAMMKADLSVGDVLEQLRKLAGEETAAAELPAANAPAGDATEGAATDAGGAEKAAAASTESSAPAPASDQVGASSAPAQGEPAAEASSDAQADGAAKSATVTVEKTSAVGKSTEPVTVKKSLYTVSSLADLLSTIRYIAMDAESEKQWEGDDSPVPARIRTWLADGAAILVAMTEEETAELIASVTPPADPVMLALAAEGDLAKAGARHSKADVEKLQTAHDALVGLGATCNCAADKAADGGDLQKHEAFEGRRDLEERPRSPARDARSACSCSRRCPPKGRASPRRSQGPTPTTSLTAEGARPEGSARQGRHHAG